VDQMARTANQEARARPEIKEPRDPPGWLDHQDLMEARASAEAQEPPGNLETRDQEDPLGRVDHQDAMVIMV